MSAYYCVSDLLCSVWRRKNETIPPNKEKKREAKYKTFIEAEAAAVEMADRPGRCRFCGRWTNSGVPLRKVISESFAEWDRCLAGEVSCVACTSARWWENARYRSNPYRYFISPDTVVELTSGEPDGLTTLKDAILSPDKKTPFIFGFAGVQYYGAIFSPLNYSTEELVGYYGNDRISVRVALNDLALLIDLRMVINEIKIAARDGSQEKGAASVIGGLLRSAPGMRSFSEERIQYIEDKLDILKSFLSDPSDRLKPFSSSPIRSLCAEEFVTILPLTHSWGWSLVDKMFSLPEDEIDRLQKKEGLKTNVSRRTSKHLPRATC